MASGERIIVSPQLREEERRTRREQRAERTRSGMTAGLVTCCCERARIEHLQVPVQHFDSAGSMVVEATAPDWMLKVPGLQDIVPAQQRTTSTLANRSWAGSCSRSPRLRCRGLPREEPETHSLAPDLYRIWYHEAGKNQASNLRGLGSPGCKGAGQSMRPSSLRMKRDLLNQFCIESRSTAMKHLLHCATVPCHRMNQLTS